MTTQTETPAKPKADAKADKAARQKVMQKALAGIDAGGSYRVNDRGEPALTSKTRTKSGFRKLAKKKETD